MEVSLEAKTAAVSLKPGVPLNAAQLRKAVADADFATRDIRAEIRGKVAPNVEKETAELAKLMLRVPGVEQSFLLVPRTALVPTSQPTSQPDKKKEPPPDLLPELIEVVAQGTTQLTITGQIVEAADRPVALSVEAFEPTAEIVEEKTAP